MTSSADVSVELPIEVEGFLTHLVVERGRSPNTLAAYRRDLRRYASFLADRGVEIGAVQPTDVVAHQAGLIQSGLAPASVARASAAVRTLHRYLAASGVMVDDPSMAVEVPPVPSAVPKALPETDVIELLDSVAGDRPVDIRDRALLETLYGTGARVSEVVGLRLGDVDLDARLVRLFGKGSKERVVPLGRPAASALAEWFDPGGRPDMSPAQWRRRDDSDAVFLNQRGGRLTRQGAWLTLRKRGEVVGLGAEMSPHVLRHSCATHMLDHGADLRTVQELLGHASISTTQTYTKVATDKLWAVYDAAHPRAVIDR